jgi:hypothetical protein
VEKLYDKKWEGQIAQRADTSRELKAKGGEELKPFTPELRRQIVLYNLRTILCVMFKCIILIKFVSGTTQTAM